ncbi:MAG: APC family permease [Chloroflexota bacterium]
MTLSGIKQFLFGKPFPTSKEMDERLDKVRALAVFASDPISSNAYATEAIMSVLIVMGSQSLALTLPIGLMVAGLILLVIFSYIQTIMHYPGGGGAYMVAKDNLGQFPSLLAAAALLTDYILTVAVSISAGVRAVTSAIPEAHEYRVYIAIIAIMVITWLNLRGMRESGTVFAIPTYAFVTGVLVTIIFGLVRQFQLFGAAPLPVMEQFVPPLSSPLGFAYVWLLLRAFAGGCTALTGIEAISDGVQAFKPPESRNAVITMVAMGAMAMTLFIGITFLSSQMHLVPEEAESILSQMTRSINGNNFLYYWVQFFTAAILFLAANTAYQDFPRLSFFLSIDKFMPGWMKNRGDRLVFTSGIVLLSLIATLIVLIFRANEIAMLPLYALGVMLSFSISQTGMFRLMGRIAHLKPGQSIDTNITHVHYEKGVRWKQALNAVGALVTLVVFIILLSTKFIEGAWIMVLIIPMLMIMFFSIHRHYERVAIALSTRELKPESLTEVANTVIIPIGDVHRGTLRALVYAKRISKDVRAICVTTSPEMKERLLMRWNRFPKLTRHVKLITIETDYRDVITPIIEYIEKVNLLEFPDKLLTVVVPLFVPQHASERLLHNQTAVQLRWALQHHKDIVIIDVPFHIDSQM